jgi:glycosyltransferase involved in cell wall biosynthesis
MKRTLWFDGNAFFRKNGIGRDSVRIRSRLSVKYEVSDLCWPILPGINPNLIRKLLNIVQAITGWAPTLPARFHGVLFQQQFSPVRGNSGLRWMIRTHDLFPVTNPEWFHWWSGRSFRSSLKAAVRSGASFICNSETTKQELLKMFPDLIDRVVVEYCEVLKLEKTKCENCDGCSWLRTSILNPFLIAVGTIEPRKQYDLLVRIWKEENRFNLIIVGRKGWKCRKIISQIKSSRNNVRWIEDCCDGALNSMYSRASAFISTSLSEGFNMPAQESRELYQLPLILSNIPVHRELHSGYATLFNNKQEALDALNKL